MNTPVMLQFSKRLKRSTYIAIRRLQLNIIYFIRKNFYGVFGIAGLLILCLGGLLPYVIYYTAPTYTTKPSDYGGFAIARNETNIIPQSISLSLNVDSSTALFNYGCEFTAEGTYNFVFVFPFHINQITGPLCCAYLSPNSTKGFVGYNTYNISTTEWGSVIWLSYENTNDFIKPSIEFQMTLDQTFLSGCRGSYSLTLPFQENFIPTVMIQEPFEEFGFNSFEPLNCSMYLQVYGLPTDAVLTGNSPQLSQNLRTGSNPLISALDTTTYVTWNVKELDDNFIINYHSPSEVDRYQNLLLIGGIFLGIGTSVTITVAYDWLKQASERKDYE
jgi:hypothetical protein